MEISHIWTAAGVLLGFQVHCLRQRVDEIAKNLESPEPHAKPGCTRLLLADFFNIAAMLVMVCVFILPAVGLEDGIMRLFAISTLLFTGHAVSVAGHFAIKDAAASQVGEYGAIAVTVIAVGLLLVCTCASKSNLPS